MDGDGSIQVNHWRKQSLLYRLEIKLKKTDGNERMLQEIERRLGGRVKVPIVKGVLGEDVLWVIDNKEEVRRMIKIYTEYPPVLTRKVMQLEFLKKCLEGDVGVEWYLANRNEKYAEQEKLIKAREEKYELPSYFGPWFAGFSEVECSFRIRENQSYAIGQKKERYLIEAIRQKLEIEAKVRLAIKAEEYWEIATAAKETLKRIIKQYETYPLIGEKLEQFERWKVELENKCN